MSYNPDRWVIIEIVNTDDTRKTTEKLYKVLAGWYGGYADGDQWRMNSGITKVEKDGDHIRFHGYTGSVYECHANSYGMSMLMEGVYISGLNQALKRGIS